MNKEVAFELLKNLVERALAADRNKFLTTREIEALEFLIDGTSGAQGAGDSAADGVTDSDFSSVELKACSVKDEDIPAGQMLCVDFGTSFSKAFASVERSDGGVDIVDLPIGDGSAGTTLITPSELFISGERIYFGVEARKHLQLIEAPSDRLIDSIKQYITLGTDVSHLAAVQMSDVQDPTKTFTKRDILVLYLAHLNYLAEQALVSKGLTKNVRRRFTHPAWKDVDKEKNEGEMRRMMAQAIILARSLGDQLTGSISADQAQRLLVELGKIKDDKLPWQLIESAVREATAAGAGALLGTGDGKRETFLVVDIGAGTTDVAGFMCVNNPNRDGLVVSEIIGAADANPTAGNTLDNLFQRYVLDESKLAQGSEEYKAAALSIRLNRRLLKETLFQTGSVIVPMPTGGPVTVSLEDFLRLPAVEKFNQTLRDLVAKLAVVAAGDLTRIKLVATGGGASLPLIDQLVDSGVDHEGKHVAFTKVDLLAEGIRDTNPELVKPYPQIAVALGGSLPQLPMPVKSVGVGFSAAPKRSVETIYKQ